MRANIVELAQVAGPKEFRRYVFDFIGEMDNFDVLGDRVMVATYIPPEKTKGGIIRPGVNLGEARFTGCVGLVLKLGQMAFKYDGAYPYEGKIPAEGDWVHYDPTNAREFFLGPKGDRATSDHGISCRTMRSDFILAIIDDPDRVGRGNGFENL